MTELPEITSIYFDPTTDFGFKKLFGEEANKDLLIDFLNSILPDSNQIKSLTFQKTEQLPNHESDRKAIFDIFCESKTGEIFIVEMQKSTSGYFMERTLYYSTFPIQYQAIKGKWDFALARVYLIGILDFDYDKNIKFWKKRQILRSFNLKDEKGIVMTDKLEFKFLQLPFFNKKPHQLTNHFDKWCYFLKNLQNFDTMPSILNEPVFVKAFDTAKVSNMSKGDYILYQISKSKKYDMELVEEEAKRRGMEEGKIEGKIEGKVEALIELVLSLNKRNYKPQEISDLVQMPLEHVMDIIKNSVEDSTKNK